MDYDRPGVRSNVWNRSVDSREVGSFSRMNTNGCLAFGRFISQRRIRGREIELQSFLRILRVTHSGYVYPENLRNLRSNRLRIFL